MTTRKRPGVRTLEWFWIAFAILFSIFLAVVLTEPCREDPLRLFIGGCQ